MNETAQNIQAQNPSRAELIKQFALRCVFCLALISMTFGAVIQPMAISPSYAAHDDDGALDDTEHVEDLEWALRNRWVPTFQMMTEQLVVNMVHQMLIVGTFFDARHQIQTQRLFQDLHTRAHKDYHPSVQMCEFGTNVRSLASSDLRRHANAQIFNKVLMDREMLKRGSPSYFSVERDFDARVRQFVTTYCDNTENNRQVEPICSSGNRNRISRDIDFTRLWELPFSLNINLTDTNITDDEVDMIAFSRYLFSTRTLDYHAPEIYNQAAAKNVLTDIRSLHALRSVPRNSFSHLVALKSQGTNEATPFLQKVLEQLEVPDDEVEAFIDENPSYFAQMEILTQKLYQRPEFYTNLYDKPANIKRTGASLRAIKLMQDRDRYESALRREMLVSLLLETKLRGAQVTTQRELQSIVPRLNRGEGGGG